MNAGWFRTLAATAPWLAAGLVTAMYVMLYVSLAPAQAVTLELPETAIADSARPGLVALVMPGGGKGGNAEGTLVFFDDARYVLQDPSGSSELSARMAELSAEKKCRELTILCDRRVPSGDLMKLMELAKKVRIGHVQIAEKRD